MAFTALAGWPAWGAAVTVSTAALVMAQPLAAQTPSPRPLASRPPSPGAQPPRSSTPGTRPLLMPDAAAPPGHGQPVPRQGWQPPVRPLRIAQGFQVGQQRWSPGHRGVDLLASAGQAVHAPAAGVISYVGTIAGVPMVSVTHDNGIRTTYQPVQASLAQGDRVETGQVIGTLTTGGSHCAQTCLHWGALRGETYLNPLTLLGRRPIILLPLTAAE